MSRSSKFFIYSIEIYRGLKTGLDAILLSTFGFAYTCKHTPTCSVYTQNQIRAHGTIRGIISGIKRIATCW